MSTAASPTPDEIAALIKEALDNAIAHHEAGQLAEAESLYRAILQIAPQHADVNHNLGQLALQLGQMAAGLELLKTALGAAPHEPKFWLSYIEALHSLGEHQAAQEVIQLGRKRGMISGDMTSSATATPATPTPKARRHNPAPAADVLQLQKAFQEGNFHKLEALARAMTEKHPDTPDGWNALRIACYRTGQTAAAMLAAQKLIELDPQNAVYHSNLSHLYWSTGQMAEATACATHAIELSPSLAEAHINLGNIYKLEERPDEAAACYRKAIALNPTLASPHSNLGIVLSEQLKLREAEASLRQAVVLEPNNAEMRSNLSIALIKLGVLDEAHVHLEKALALDPSNVLAYTQLLFILNYSNTGNSPEALALAKKYGAMLTRKVAPQYDSWECTPVPKRLKVGMVSGDFCNHPVGYFVEGILQHIDPERLELVAYDNLPPSKHDRMSERLRQHFSAWHPLYGLSDEKVAAKIRADGIHVLLDLSGHTTYNRLPVFARKPAPVQATWLAYFATTGVEQIDYLIADPNVCPPGEESHFTEAIWRLPETYMCFTPPDIDVDTAPPPALDNGYITFGCFNNLSKMTDAVASLWAEVLKRVPGSKLFLKSAQLNDLPTQRRTVQRFAALGIPAERLIIEGPSLRQHYLEAYNRIDIALDPFPYPGGTTTVECLWMSVPVLTLRGNRMLSHAGENIMRNAGLPDWISVDEADYVAKAVRFASDLPHLIALRSRLREQVLASPIFDAARFARNFENAIWGMWQARKP